MSADTLAALAGVVLSLAFSYIPGLSGKFDGLDPIYKRLIMLGLIILVALGVFGLACAGIAEFAGGVTCDRAGLVGLVQAFLAALVANQAVYMISPKKAAGPYFPVARRPENSETWADPR